MPKIITQIEIKRKRKESADTRRPIDLAPLPRRIGRRRLRDEYNYLRVFDVGLTADGADTNLFFHRPEPSLPYFVQFLGPSPVTMSMTGTLDSQRYANWNSQMLAVDHEEWPETYKEITEILSDYSIRISGFDTFIDGEGLRSSSGQDSIVVVPTALEDEDKWFPRWPIGGLVPRFVKYTSTPSYAAPSVSFIFDADCDLFLVPSTMYGFGSSTYDPAGPSPIYSHQYHFVQRVRSRNALLGNPYWDNVWANRTTPGSISPGGKSLLLSYFVDDLDGHTYRLRATHPSGAQTIDGDNPVQFPGSDFPLFAERTDWRVSPELNVPHIDIIFGGLPAGMLIAVIRKHLGEGVYEWYFVWTNSTFGGVPFINNVEV